MTNLQRDVQAGAAKDTCRHCASVIFSFNPNAGGAAWRDEKYNDWVCPKNPGPRPSSLGPHRPNVTPREIEETIASILNGYSEERP